MVATVNSTGTSTGVVITPDSSGVLALQTGGTTAVTVDASQNVGIGTASPSTYGQFAVYTAASNTEAAVVSGGANYATYRLQNSSIRYSMQIRTDQSNAWVLRDETAGANRLLVDTSGNLLVGCTSRYSTIVQGLQLQASGSASLALSRTTDNGTVARFFSTSTDVGNISVTGSTTTFNSTSDYRLKENVQPMTGALAKVAQLKPVTYKWKVDGSDGQGFIAHELAEVVPDCVTGEKDALDKDGNPSYQGIDTSFLVATLTAALQETKALIDTQAETINALTARIVALEAK